MANTFLEAKKELSDNVKCGKSGKKIRSFSKTEFNNLVKSMLNDTEYEATSVKLVNGKLTNISTPVIKDIREKIFVPILTRAGVDKVEAEKLAKDYKFSTNQTSMMYDFISNAIYEYMDAGKKFNFPNKPDFVGSIRLQENEDAIVERDVRDPKDRKNIIGHKKEERKAHKTLVKKSACPTWQKHVL